MGQISILFLTIFASLGVGYYNMNTVGELAMARSQLQARIEAQTFNQSAITLLKSHLSDSEVLDVENGVFVGNGSDNLMIKDGKVLIQLAHEKQLASKAYNKIYLGNDLRIKKRIARISVIDLSNDLLSIKIESKSRNNRLIQTLAELSMASTGLGNNQEVALAEGDFIIGSTEDIGGTVIFRDDFERENTVDPVSAFHWDLILDDSGNIGNETMNNCWAHVCAKILGSDRANLGPMGEGQKSLFMIGRQGGSIHDIYLTSKTFNLSAYDKVQVDFKLLTIDIGDHDGSGNPLQEFVSVDVCMAGDADCNHNSEHWKPIFIQRWSQWQSRL